MSRHLIAATLSLFILADAGTVLATVATQAQPEGVTTLKPDSAGSPQGWQWQGGVDADTPFTSVAVIEDGAQIPTGAALASLPDAASALPTSLARADGGVAERTGGGAHLPEPSTWILLFIGLGMIGFALRGLVSANRRLARLEASEEA